MPKIVKDGREKRENVTMLVANDEENDLLQRAADIKRRPKAQFIRVAALEAAERIVAEAEAKAL